MAFAIAGVTSPNIESAIIIPMGPIIYQHLCLQLPPDFHLWLHDRLPAFIIAAVAMLFVPMAINSREG